MADGDTVSNTSPSRADKLLKAGGDAPLRKGHCDSQFQDIEGCHNALLT
jgi:hypothetical protein